MLKSREYFFEEWTVYVYFSMDITMKTIDVICSSIIVFISLKKVGNVLLYKLNHCL